MYVYTYVYTHAYVYMHTSYETRQLSSHPALRISRQKSCCQSTAAPAGSPTRSGGFRALPGCALWFGECSYVFLRESYEYMCMLVANNVGHASYCGSSPPPAVAIYQVPYLMAARASQRVGGCREATMPSSSSLSSSSSSAALFVGLA